MVGLLALSTAKSGQIGNEAAICSLASAKGLAHLSTILIVVGCPNALSYVQKMVIFNNSNYRD